MAKAEKQLTVQQIIRMRIRELENEISALETETSEKKNQLTNLRQVEKSYITTAGAKKENLTYKQMAYHYLKERGSAYMPEIVDHYFPGVGEDRHIKVTCITKALNALIETKSIKKIPAPKGKRGIRYEFIK